MYEAHILVLASRQLTPSQGVICYILYRAWKYPYNLFALCGVLLDMGLSDVYFLFVYPLSWSN